MVDAPYRFLVEFHGNGAFRKRFTVPASATRGLSFVPDFESVCAEVPARFWPAIHRALWWDTKGCPSMPLRLDMLDKKGAPIGSLFATPWKLDEAD
jgi:hypothetical protein